MNCGSSVFCQEAMTRDDRAHGSPAAQQMGVLLEPQRGIERNAVLAHALVRIADGLLVMVIGLVDRVVRVRAEPREQLRERTAVHVEALTRGVATERLLQIDLRWGSGDDRRHASARAPSRMSAPSAAIDSLPLAAEPSRIDSASWRLSSWSAITASSIVPCATSRITVTARV